MKQLRILFTISTTIATIIGVVFLLSLMATPPIPNAKAMAVANGDLGVTVEPLEQTKVARPGQSIVFTHTVTNLGPQEDTYDITINEPISWEVELAPAEISLEKNLTTTLTLTVKVPPIVSLGKNHAIQATVQSRTNPEVTSVVTDTMVFYGQYLPALYKSSAWNQVGEWNDTANGPVIAMDVCQNTILAGALNDLWEYDTSVQNSSWQKLEIPFSQESSRLTSIVFTADCQKVYASLYGEGVIEGKRQDTGWRWESLSGGVAVTHVRSMILANDILLAGGDSGIVYWEDGSWKSAPLPESKPDFTQQPIMHLDITDPTQNTGTVFAAQWVNPTVWRLFNGTLPQDGLQPVTRNGAPNLPTIRTIVSEGSNNFLVGTSDKLFLVTPAGWQEMSTNGTRSLMIAADNKIYAGHLDSKGVSMAPTVNRPFSSHNRGWTPPEAIYELLEGSDGVLYAATTTGVWVYR